MDAQFTQQAADFSRLSEEGYTELIAVHFRQRWDDANTRYIRDLEIHFAKHDSDTHSFRKFFDQLPAFLQLRLHNVQHLRFESSCGPTLELLIREPTRQESTVAPICFYTLDEDGYDADGPFFCLCDSFECSLIKPP